MTILELIENLEELIKTDLINADTLILIEGYEGGFDNFTIEPSTVKLCGPLPEYWGAYNNESLSRMNGQEVSAVLSERAKII